jgi:hypothetical protein
VDQLVGGARPRPALTPTECVHFSARAARSVALPLRVRQYRLPMAALRPFEVPGTLARQLPLRAFSFRSGAPSDPDVMRKERITVGLREREFGEDASCREAPDFVGGWLREPQRAIWAGCYPPVVHSDGTDGEFGNCAGGSYAPDLVRPGFGEPKRTVWSWRDSSRARRKWKFGDDAPCRRSPGEASLRKREKPAAIVTVS